MIPKRAIFRKGKGQTRPSDQLVTGRQDGADSLFIYFTYYPFIFLHKALHRFGWVVLNDNIRVYSLYNKMLSD
jgi:hypothetical protein